MCGIVGIVHKDTDTFVSSDVIRTMCASIRHRGPDDEGIHVQGRIGVGMRRLSIIDLAGGQQPIFNEDRSKLIVFNGEIYNYNELQSGLLSRGHLFRSKGDTETILHLYEEEGVRCVDRLRGMFAFAIWDETHGRLLLAGDRFGIKPLYVVERSWGIAFASELKALQAVGLTGDDLDWNALDLYFHLGYIPAPATPYVGVRKLEPGFALTWDSSHGSEYFRYWDLPTAETMSVADSEKRVLEWIDESVKAHMVSDVPVAAFLSGGLDSSAVVSSMAQSGEVPHAYTVRYHGAGADAADESPLASALARRYDAQLTVVDVEPDVRDLVEPIALALDEPHADESAIPTWLISKRVASEYKVALIGTGGDELFAGYRRHIGVLATSWWSRVPKQMRRMIRAGVNSIPEPRGGALTVNRLKRFVRSHADSFPERYFEMIDRRPVDRSGGLYDPELAESIDSTSAVELFKSYHTNGNGPNGLRGALYLDYKTYLPGDLLHLSDRISMAHSLEVRVPFVDHTLVEQAFPIPDRVKIGPWKLKRLLRGALRPRLPAAHFSAPKRGFVGPTALWLRNELRDTLVDELATDRLGSLGYFNSQAVSELIDDHLSLRQNNESTLWALLCFSIWHRVCHDRYRNTKVYEAGSGPRG